MVSTRSMLDELHASRKRMPPNNDYPYPTHSKKAKKQHAVARVSLDGLSTVNHHQVLQDIRKRILGTRIARTLPNKQHCIGKVISVRTGVDLDDDLYRVAYEDNVSEDLNPLLLFDALLCYARITPNCGIPIDICAAVKRDNELDNLIDLLAQHSEKTLRFLYSFHYRDAFGLRARIYDEKRRAFGTVIGCTVKSTRSRRWTVLYDNGEEITDLRHRDVGKFSKLYKDYAENDPVPIDPEYEALHEEVYHDLICKRLISPLEGL